MTDLKKLADRDRMVAVLARYDSAATNLAIAKNSIDSMMFELKVDNDFHRDTELDKLAMEINEAYMAMSVRISEIRQRARTRLNELKEETLQ